MKRSTLAVCALVCALLAFSWVTPLRATDGPAQLVNAERISRGIPPLTIDSGLDSCAQRHSDAMAARGEIWHDLSQTAYACAGAWVGYGENVGMGHSISAVHQAFMASPDHRRNILEPLFNRIGTGVAWSNGVVYVTEIFVDRLARRVRVVTTHRPPDRRTPTRPHKLIVRRRPKRAPTAAPVTVAMLLRLLAWEGD